MVSIIMPCWVNDLETLSVTSSAVESFVGFGQRDQNVELILVDNNSLVGAGWLRSKADIYIRYPQNRGYTVAMNDGIKISHGDTIAWANNDIRVAPNWLDVCEEILKDKTIATVHPKMVNYDDSFVYGNTIEDNERFCQNSFVVTKHKDFLFDERYGIGGGADDWDMAARIRKMGYKRVWTDKTAFQHKHSFSLKKLGPERQKVVDQNNQLFREVWGTDKEELFKKEGWI